MTNQKRKELAWELRHEDPSAASRFNREDRAAAIQRRLDELKRRSRAREAAKRAKA